MKYIWFIIPILLTGCVFDHSVPIEQTWPSVPKELLSSCPDLALVNPKTDKLSDIVSVVSDNYATYYDCKSKVDDWITWYEGQMKIYDRK